MRYVQVRFNPRKADRPVYTAPSVDVFRMLLVTGSSLEDDFLDMDIDKDVRKMLLDAAKKGPVSAADITAHRNLFFDRASELDSIQVCHGDILLIDSKHRKWRTMFSCCPPVCVRACV